MTNGADAFAALCRLLAADFARERRPGADSACKALLHAAGQRAHAAHGKDAPLHKIWAAAIRPHALVAAQHAHRCASLLSWSHWGVDELSASTAAGLHTAELVGPNGLVFAADVRVGLLCSDAHIDYPRSAHAAEETYIILSGTALWSVGEEPFSPRPPGALVHHPSWVPHARRTLEEPFLGAWRWSGDLDLSTFKLVT